MNIPGLTKSGGQILMPTATSITQLISMPQVICVIASLPNTIFRLRNFRRLGIGPIYTTIHAQFFREVRMGETVNHHICHVWGVATGWTLEGSS